MNRQLIPGFILVGIISIVSIGIRQLLMPFIVIETLTIAIIIGMVFSHVVSKYESAKSGIQYSLKNFLMAGIVLLGFSLDYKVIIDLGPKIIGLVIFYVTVTLVLSYIIGKAIGVNKPLAMLIGVGSSICGASAVVAVSPCIHADEDDTIIAVSIVSFLGTIGVVAYTMISHISGINAHLYGIWSGISLHGVSHAVAAAFSLGEASGEIGTLVKMARVLMLAPVSIILSYQFREQDSKRNRAKVPPYIFFFLVAGAMNTFISLPTQITSALQSSSKFLILLAMAAMGLSIDFVKIKNKGLKSILLGIFIFVLMSIVSISIINSVF